MAVVANTNEQMAPTTAPTGVSNIAPNPVDVVPPKVDPTVAKPTPVVSQPPAVIYVVPSQPSTLNVISGMAETLPLSSIQTPKQLGTSAPTLAANRMSLGGGGGGSAPEEKESAQITETKKPNWIAIAVIAVGLYLLFGKKNKK